jgi:enoyl-CoA hydratase
MGFSRALKSSLDLDVLLNAASDPVKDEFNRIRREEGVGAAIAWRDARFRDA